MTEETKKQFQKNLKTFYTAFTGNENMPPEITKFSDIKLRDYRSIKGCQGDTPVLKTKYTLSKNSKLFLQYAENTKNMIQNAANNQSKLLAVINELFTYVIDPYTSKKVIRVNPKLTEESLQAAVEKSRRMIVNLYVKCENDYTNGIKLYEAIVEAKILETTKNQIVNLEKQAKTQIDETKKIISPIPVSKTITSKNIPAVVINEPSETISNTTTSSTLSPSDTTLTPSSSTFTPSSSTFTPSDSTFTPSSSTLTPSSSTLTPSDTTFIPSDSTLTTSDTTLKPSNTTLTTSDTTLTPSDSTDSNKNIQNIVNSSSNTTGLTESSYNSLPLSAVTAPNVSTTSNPNNIVLT